MYKDVYVYIYIYIHTYVYTHTCNVLVTALMTLMTSTTDSYLGPRCVADTAVQCLRPRF